VVIDDAAFTDDDRRAIVCRVRTSHAAFIDAGVGIAPAVRFFTTEGELTNCGHGTIAAQAVLLEQRGARRHRGWQHTGGRTFATTAVRRPDGVEVWFDQGMVELEDCPGSGRDGILAALRIGPDDLAADDDVRVASPGTPRLLVPVVNREALLAIRPDVGRLAAECRGLGYLGCFMYVASTTGEAAAGRMFAPAIGVDEDVVNANSAGCLAAHLLSTHRNSSIEVHQGDALGRSSSVFATATATAEGISTRIGGIAAVRPDRMRSSSAQSRRG
jgi:PhzF family phenazine biosynthesis protein